MVDSNYCSTKEAGEDIALIAKSPHSDMAKQALQECVMALRDDTSLSADQQAKAITQLMNPAVEGLKHTKSLETDNSALKNQLTAEQQRAKKAEDLNDYLGLEITGRDKLLDGKDVQITALKADAAKQTAKANADSLQAKEQRRAEIIGTHQKFAGKAKEEENKAANPELKKGQSYWSLAEEITGFKRNTGHNQEIADKMKELQALNQNKVLVYREGTTRQGKPRPAEQQDNVTLRDEKEIEIRARAKYTQALKDGIILPIPQR